MKNRIKIKKILVPVDGSPNSMKAAHIGIGLSKRFESELIALTVINLLSLPYGYAITQPGTSLHDSILGEKRKEARKWLDEVESSVLNVFTETKYIKEKIRSEIVENPSSKVETAIIDYAEKEGINLIVMGTRGRSDFKRAVLGSVASGVLSYAQCSVMMIR